MCGPCIHAISSQRDYWIHRCGAWVRVAAGLDGQTDSRLIQPGIRASRGRGRMTGMSGASSIVIHDVYFEFNWNWLIAWLIIAFTTVAIVGVRYLWTRRR